MDPRRAEEIEKEARRLRLDLDRRKFQVWDNPPEDPIDRIDLAKIAVHLLGAELVETEDITSVESSYLAGNLPHRIGAYVDRTKNTIGIARCFRLGTRRFTLAHAIGHWQLHKSNLKFHDGPLLAGDRIASGLLPTESEANSFAEELLMPATLVRSYFQRVFQAETLRHSPPDEDLADLLASGTRLSVTASGLMVKGREHIALLAAELVPSKGSLPSLSARFRVSSLAMAVRLQRLGLV